MRVPLFWQVLPIYCLILSFFVLPMWQHHAAVVNAEAAGRVAQNNLVFKKAVENRIVAGEPTQVVLPRQGIDLPVVGGTYDFTAAKWTVTNQTANFARNTVDPNNKS